MKKSISIVAVAVLALGLGACQTNNQQMGGLTGGVVGGMLGNTIGKGSGRTAATIGGAILGTVMGGAVGANMDRSQQAPVVVQQAPAPVYQSTDSCAQYRSNDGAYSACQRGVAQRAAEYQRQLEAEAYRAGKGQ
jgi:outer membrane lipoprotein SlyB